MQAAMMSTARRSPRYLGNYDETGGATIDDDIRETHQPTLLTQRKDINNTIADIKGTIKEKTL